MAVTNYYNRVEVKDKRRALRSEETPAEALLWECLRDRRLGGLKFRRQHSVGVYILDFYCSASQLAVELDGPSHASAEAQKYDAERTEFLATLHIRVLRFANAVVHRDITAVLQKIITTATSQPSSSSPSPCLRRGSQLVAG